MLNCECNSSQSYVWRLTPAYTDCGATADIVILLALTVMLQLIFTPRTKKDQKKFKGTTKPLRVNLDITPPDELGRM